MADTPTFYLFHGNDDMAIEAAVKQLRAGMGDDANAAMNISDYQGEEVTVPKVLNDVKSFPFLADKRLVIVKGFVANLMRTNHGKQQLDTLIEQIPNLPPHARLVLVEREKLRSNLKIVTAAEKHGFCREYSVPKDATGWILNRAETEYDAKIEPQAAAALASVIGTDLRAADNELVKLVTYVDGERAITEKDVALLTAYVADANVFDMVDALATGNGQVAISLLTQSLEQDPTDPGFRLFSLIARQFRLLLLAREHLDSGGSSNNNAIAKVLGIHPYPAGKVATQSRRFTVPQLEKIYRRVQQYDAEMKTGRIKPRLALELLVASLSKG